MGRARIPSPLPLHSPPPPPAERLLLKVFKCKQRGEGGNEGSFFRNQGGDASAGTSVCMRFAARSSMAMKWRTDVFYFSRTFPKIIIRYNSTLHGSLKDGNFSKIDFLEDDLKVRVGSIHWKHYSVIVSLPH